MPELLDLPAELLNEIAKQLLYPDSLALKLSCRYFHDNIHPCIIERVRWLLNRNTLGLPIPMSNQLNLKTDAGFCSSPEVRRFLRHRRKHWECHVYGHGRCLVSGKPSCPRAVTDANRTTAEKSAISVLSALTIQWIYLFIHSNIETLLIVLLSLLTPTTWSFYPIGYP